MNTAFRPRPWTAAEAQDDSSWTLRLSPEAAEGFHQALLHAKATGKAYTAMTPADFPLPEASRAALTQAIDLTQGRWGMCLVKGLPSDRWTEDEARLANWGSRRWVTCISRAAPARLPVRSTASRVAKKDSFISFSSLPVAEMWLYTRGGRPQNS
jgi:hypothetical protein